jgi:putative hemolysin
MNPFTWLVIVVLILVNALYVAAEFAAVSARRSRIKQLATEGNRLARALLPVLEDGRRLDRYVAACQIGITLSSLILGAYGQANLAAQLRPVFERWGGELAAQSTATVVVLIILTGLQVVIGELVPKALALQFPTQAALYTVLPMRWSLALFTPFIAVLNGSATALLRLADVRQGGHRHIHSPEEIDLLIAESRDGGLLEPDEQRRLHDALHLSTLRAHQLMVPRTDIVAIDAGLPIDDVLRIASESQYTRLPVYRGSIDHITGLLHSKDLAGYYVQHGNPDSIEALLRPVEMVPEGMTADQLLNFLRERRTHVAIVLDEFGGVAGMVTLEDVLAEILGDVGDEFKADSLLPERLPDGRVRLAGRLRLDEAEEWIGVPWDSEEADTVGGRVTEALGHLPLAGERTTIDGVEVEVERVARHAVLSVLARPVAVVVEQDDS